MNPSKTEDDLFLHHHPHDLDPHHQILPHHHHHHHHHHHQVQLQPSIPNPSDDPSFSLPEIVLFRASSSESPSHSSTDSPPHSPIRAPPASNSISNSTNNPSHQPLFISPEPHISSQFYTFNPESHALMIRCILEQRLATSSEIRAATPRAVLKSWRAVWKDRNEETAYLTAWKRIQDKLTAHVDENVCAKLRIAAWLWSFDLTIAFRNTAAC